MDRVQVLKQESTANGGDGADEVEYPTPIEPEEDALEMAGIYLQAPGERDETVCIRREPGTGRAMFTDSENTTALSLTNLLTFDFVNHVFNEQGGFVYTGDMDPVTRS